VVYNIHNTPKDPTGARKALLFLLLIKQFWKAEKPGIGCLNLDNAGFVVSVRENTCG